MGIAVKSIRLTALSIASRRYVIIGLLAAAMVFTQASYSPCSEEPEPERNTLNVGLYLNAPFVMKNIEGLYSGMAIDIWSIVASRLGYTTKYVEYTNVADLLSAVKRGDIDLIVSNLTVTHERAQWLEFSYPWYDSGLRIMVNTEYRGSVFEELKNGGQLENYVLIISLLVVLTVGLTIIQRPIDSEFPRGWKDGLAISLYSLLRTVKSGDLNLKSFGWVGYFMRSLWMIFGVAIMAYILSTVTSAMTSVNLESEISSFSDLYNKKVAVISGHLAESYLKRMGIETIPFDDFAAAAKAVVDEKVQAFVAESPVLEFWDKKYGGNTIEIVGTLFHPEKYAFAGDKSNEDLVDAISIELMGLHDNGVIEQIKDHYFGVENK